MPATAGPTPSVPRHHQLGPCDVSPRQEESTMLWERPRSRDGSQPVASCPGAEGHMPYGTAQAAATALWPSVNLFCSTRLGCGQAPGLRPSSPAPRFASQCGLSRAAGGAGCRQARRDPTGHMTGSSPDSSSLGLPWGTPRRWDGLTGGDVEVGAGAVGGASAKGASLVGQSGGGRMVSDSALGNPSCPAHSRQLRSRPCLPRHPGTHRTPPGVVNQAQGVSLSLDPAQEAASQGLGPWC